jgi:acetyl-CoA carboxylase biotin carboxyl carrier protein
MAKNLARNVVKNGGKTAAKTKPSVSASGIDYDTVRELARIATEFNLAEVEADPTGHVRVRRDVGMGTAGADERIVVRPPAPLAHVGPAAVEAVPAADGTFISSPFVGTFYRSPSPESNAFIEVGQAVRKGQVVCIVEAMKLMNEIEAETDGVVAEILVQNAAHVEYGQHLFRLTKS